jgi:hypothetical protein
MMNNTRILIAGINADGLAKSLHNQPGWRMVTATAVEAAIEEFHRQHFDAVVLDDSLENAEALKLRCIFLVQQPGLAICKANGSAGSDLAGTIREELGKARLANKPAIVFTDDALKNAGLPITVQ